MSDRGRRGRTQKRRTLRTDATRTNTHRLYGSCIRKYIHLQTIQKIFPKPENRGEGNEDSMRGVEKKSIATSDTRFVENIQKNGIRVEINDTYRMYKQYVLFSDAKTPSRRDFSFFFLHWPNPPFRGHCFYRHDDVADCLVPSFPRHTPTRERTTTREEVRALYDAVSFFLFLCFVFSSRCARRARRPRVSYASGEHREKRARGSAAGDPGTSFFARNRDGVDDATGRTTRRGSRTITGGDFLPNVSSSASLASSSSSSSSRTRTEDTPGVGGRVPLDSSSGGAPRAVAQTVVPTVFPSSRFQPTDRPTDGPTTARAYPRTDGRRTEENRRRRFVPSRPSRRRRVVVVVVVVPPGGSRVVRVGCRGPFVR
jgi:hypothetical protein